MQFNRSANLRLALKALYEWERNNLPCRNTPEARELLLWLLKPQGGARLLKDLYRSSRFSEPTMRQCLKHFERDGFIVIEENDSDMRARCAKPTAKLWDVMAEYQRKFSEIAASLAESKVLISTSGPPTAADGAKDVLPRRG
ncbi:MAG: hypothetical protein U1E23_10615 [Reyranellaceae bacterium]